MKLSILLLAVLAPIGVLGASVLLENNQGVQDVPVKAMQERFAWKNCGLDTDPIQLQSIKVIPDPPKPGQNLTVTVKAHVIEQVEEGAYADVVVKLGLIKLLHRKFDLCEEARNANVSVQCPVEKGDYDVQQTIALPREIPRAKFAVSFRGYTNEEDDLACADLFVDFRPEFPHLAW